MEITYIGHSCFKIKTKTSTIVTDPYDPKMLGYKLPKLEADILLISHDHGDHNYSSGVTDNKLSIITPGEFESNGVYIIGIPTFHDNESGEKRGKNTIFLIEADGLNVLFLGDLGHELSKEILEKLPNIHVLLIPVGGEYTIDYKVATKVISSIEPSIAIPMHYQTSDLANIKLAGLDKFLDEMGAEDVKPIEKLKIGSKSDIPDEAEVVVLEPQH